ncbi:MAG: DUF58 domain-containing protein [gamma proteobacterium symbiont of Bathyaustriella thionipta]|nr:DUF58 domain-containing protein [gamma proteobacterium symbiont of Bathyaustriella thionipta]
MPVPARPLFLLLAILWLLSLPLPWFTDLQSAWLWLAIGLLIFSLLDLLALLLQKTPQGRRQVNSTLPLGQWTTVSVRLTNRQNRRQHYRIFDHYPSRMQLQGLPQSQTIKAHGWSQIEYQIRPEERGLFHFAAIELRLLSPFGLWQQARKIAAAQKVRVYPNFAAVAHYILLASDNRLSQLGIRKSQRRGSGLDFHQMRDYREGDSLRQIDWKASSRLRRPIARESQDERDQEIVFLIDCGRRMRARDDELSHFDHTLNAILLLSYVALRQGDAVGMQTFAGEPRLLKPAKGPATQQRMLNALYDLQPTNYVPDYTQAATHFLAHQNKRSLIILISNVRDEDNSDLLPAIRLLQRKHLLLLISLREEALDQAARQPAKHFHQALQLAAVHGYLAQRKQAIRQLQVMGADCLDVSPSQLTVSLINRYHEIKSAGQL